MIYTFGHSTLDPADAGDLLMAHGISHLVDIRSHPGSAHVPQWNRGSIDLKDWGVDYNVELRLGGWSENVDLDWEIIRAAQDRHVAVEDYLQGFFPKQRIAKRRTSTSGELAPTWTNQGLYDYSWFMANTCFRDGLSWLIELDQHGSLGNVAIMCAEFLWWKCHRSMVADALAVCGQPVFHLQPQVSEHIYQARLERYDPEIREIWKEWWL